MAIAMLKSLPACRAFQYFAHLWGLNLYDAMILVIHLCWRSWEQLGDTMSDQCCGGEAVIQEEGSAQKKL